MSTQKFHGVSYGQRKTAEWLSTLLQSGVEMRHSFFTCLEWSIGSLRGVLKKIVETAEARFHGNTDPEVAEALKAVTAALQWPEAKLVRDFSDIVNDISGFGLRK